MVGAYLLKAALLVLTVYVVGHILLTKRNDRAAIGWVGFVLFSPLAGLLLYYLLGINRIKRRALGIYKKAHPPLPGASVELPRPWRRFQKLDRLVSTLTGTPLTTGNRITPLVGGDAAYPSMVEAINTARHSVALLSYIFKTDRAGRSFAHALRAAVRRGVQVRVLIDGFGGYNTPLPTMYGLLRRHRVPVARFLHSFFPWEMPYLNLRNHRKILIVDGTYGFTGGMNISGHTLKSFGRKRMHDVHFKVEGPVISQLLSVFADDWLFSTGEPLRGDPWTPRATPLLDGGYARVLTAGPDEPSDRLLSVLTTAIFQARHSISLSTPYFLPPQHILTALSLAAKTGVQVDIFIPSRSDHLLIDMGVRGKLGEVISQGCAVWEVPPPFDHSKLCVIDDVWCFVGSANWDARSLDLNFECNVEAYHLPLARRLRALMAEKKKNARLLSVEHLASLSALVRLRNASVRLLSPYL